MKANPVGNNGYRPMCEKIVETRGHGNGNESKQRKHTIRLRARTSGAIT